MSKVSRTTLGKLVNFQRGYDLPKSNFVNGEYPVISSNGTLGYHNEFKVEGPGITIGRSGTVGLPHFIEKNFFPHNTSLFVEDFKGNDKKYIFYLLKNLKLNKQKSGSGVPTMNRNHLHPLPVMATLEKNEQQKIATVLSTLDEHIELNQNINSKLEQMIKTIYDFWFIQFDFPNDNSQPYKFSGGKMEYNSLLKQKIPYGWVVETLCSVAKTSLGGTPSTKNLDYWDNSNIAWLNSSEIANFPIVESEQFITPKGIENSAAETLPKGSVVISIVRYIRPSILGIEAATNQSVVGVYENKRFKKSFIYPYFCSQVPQLMSLRTGAQQPHINKGTVDDSLIVVPDHFTLEKYYELVDPIFNEIITRAFETKKLTELREWLMPMLMNGQVQVR